MNLAPLSRVCILLTLCIGLGHSIHAQSFTWNPVLDSVQQTTTDVIVDFESYVINHTDSTLVLEWRFEKFWSSSDTWYGAWADELLLWSWHFTDSIGNTTLLNDSMMASPKMVISEEEGRGWMRICLYDPIDSAGTYTCQTFSAETDSITGISALNISSNHLKQNYPNPFAGQTTVEYSISSSHSQLRIQDVHGRVIREVDLDPTQTEVTIDIEAPRGVYYYSLWEDDTFIASRRMRVE